MNFNDTYFVMLNTQEGGFTPMEINGETLFSDSLELAKKRAEDTVLGSEFGYEVFQLGEGVFFK